MADINSDVITNLLASPPVMNAAIHHHGRLRRKVAEIELDGTQNNNDVLRFFRVKSSDSIYSLELSCDALTGATDVNFGLHTINGGAAVDDNAFDDAQTLASALVRQEKRVGTNSALNIDTLNLPVWDLATGVTADPGVEYDVTATLIAAGSASGTVVLEMLYTSGD